MKNVLRSVMLLAVFALLVPTVQGSLVGHWMFDEATSGAGTGVAADSSGNAYDGTLNGGAVYTTGQVGSGALQFNGTDSFVAVPYQEPMALVDSDYTISVWSKWEGPNASAAHTYQMTVSLETGYTWDGWYVAYNETNYVKYGHNSGSQLDSSPWVVPDTDYDPLAEGNLNEWKCLTVVYDKDGSEFGGNRDFYVDGVLVASSPTIMPLTWSDAWYLNFGVYDVGYTQEDYRGYYLGALDDIQIYNHALSAANVATVAAGGVISDPFPGDTNNDGVVDDTDATTLASNWLSSGADWSMGDFNGDGIVDDVDATILATNWQVGVTAGVPEPSTVVLIVMGSLGLLLHGWRKRN